MRFSSTHINRLWFIMCMFINTIGASAMEFTGIINIQGIDKKTEIRLVRDPGSYVEAGIRYHSWLKTAKFRTKQKDVGKYIITIDTGNGKDISGSDVFIINAGNTFYRVGGHGIFHSDSSSNKKNMALIHNMKRELSKEKARVNALKRVFMFTRKKMDRTAIELAKLKKNNKKTKLMSIKIARLESNLKVLQTELAKTRREEQSRKIEDLRLKKLLATKDKEIRDLGGKNSRLEQAINRNETMSSKLNSKVSRLGKKISKISESTSDIQNNADCKGVAKGVAGHGFWVRHGDSVFQTLKKWSDMSGWILAWNSDYIRMIAADACFGGDYKKAVTSLIHTLATSANPIKGDFYTNRVLRITDLGNTR